MTEPEPSAPRVQPARACLVYTAAIAQPSSGDLMRYVGELLSQNVRLIDVLISSPGGTVVDGLTLHNFLRTLPPNVTVNTHNLGNVDSAALMLYLAGKRRTVATNGQFVMHGVYYRLPRAVKIDRRQLREKMALTDADHERLADTVAACTSIAKADALAAYENERVWGAAEAVAVGLAHKVEDYEVRPGTAWASIADPQPK